MEQKESTFEDIEQSSSSNQKVARKSIKKEEEISGRAIILDYVLMKYGSLPRYQQLCAALDTFDSWTEESRITFLDQFMDSHDILDVNCDELVYKLCKIQWNLIPKTILPNFVNFLSALAISHIHHINRVFCTFVTHLSPLLLAKESDGYVMILDEQSQESLYQMALLSIKTVITSNPLSNPIFIKCCVKQFPHIKQPAPKLLGYVRNLIDLANWTSDDEVAAELWSLIIEKLLLLDASCTAELQDEELRLSFCNHIDIRNGSSSYQEELEEETENKDNPLESKLDSLMALVLVYLGGDDWKADCGGESNPFSAFKNDPNFKSLLSSEKRMQRKQFEFRLLLEAFDEHVLAAVGVHSAPFIWFYLCSLSKENCSLMLDFLWEVLQSPVDSPNEWRKTHNAAAFLCGFLARANYVDFELSCYWMRKLSLWCREYAERFATMKNSRGYGIQHGTFYAIVQSLLFIFCYRHGEMQENDAFDEVRAWQLDKVVHSHLEPLRWISQGVTLCFLAVNRHLQLVRHNKNLLESSTHSSNRKRRRTPLDLFFPFSFCSLEICSTLFLPLMRRFSPIQMTHSYEADEDVRQSKMIVENGPIEMNKMINEDGLIDMDEQTKENDKDNDMEEIKEAVNGPTGLMSRENDVAGSYGNMPVDEGYEEELMLTNDLSTKYFGHDQEVME